MSNILQGYENLAELLLKRTEASGAQTAYVFLSDSDETKHSLTYSQLLDDVRTVGGWLARETAPKDRVLLLFPQGPEFLSAYWGCMWAGRIGVPLPPPRAAHIATTLRHLADVAVSVQATTVLTTSAILSAATPLIADFPELATLKWECVETLSTEPLIDPVRSARTDVAMLQFTSGSTDQPKGVMLTHENLLFNTHYFDLSFIHGPQSRILTWLPPFHDLGLIYGLLTPVLCGIPAYVLPRVLFAQRPARWIEAINHFRITHTAGPDFGYRSAAAGISQEQLATLDLSCLVSAVSGAEPVRMDTMEEFAIKFAPAGFQRRAFCPGWGLAEAACVVTASHRDSPGPLIEGRRDLRQVFLDSGALAERRIRYCESGLPNARSLVSNGPAIGATTLRIVDPDTCVECSEEQIGEIWVHNPCVAQGYWNNPEASEATFGGVIANSEDGRRYLRTGDLGFIFDGDIYIAGRIKDLIIVRGQNHYPQDIERACEEAHPLVHAGSIAAFSIETAGEESVVIVTEVPRRFSPQNAEEVFGSIRRAVANAHGLRLAAIALVRYGSIPKTTSGKIQRKRTREEFNNGKLKLVAEWRTPELMSDASDPGGAKDNLERHTVSAIADWLANWIAKYSGIAFAQVVPDRVFGEFGLDSMAVAQLAGEAARRFGKANLPESAIYDHPTIADMAKYIADSEAGTVAPTCNEPVKTTNADIGIIGMSARFPGARNIEEFWQLLTAGRRTISLPDTSRTGLLARLGAQNDNMPAGYLDDIEQFDPGFFKISPREAAQIDPQHRILLMAVWHAIEDAGLTHADLEGSRTGVFVGACATDYSSLCMHPQFALDGYAAPGMSAGIAANRISYFLGFHGPSMVIDTACSSSLVAFHQAAQSIRAGDCDRAIVAGVNLILNPVATAVAQRAGMLSQSGACQSFDASADGYIRGEGVGVVVLSTADLINGGFDRALAWVAGSAVNQDGRSFGLTAPNGEAQRAVMRSALAAAGLEADQVGYIEAHGTGTPLGDPIEFSALADVYGANRTAPAMVGAVKSNIGHLEGAAGIAGIIKAVLCLRRGAVPPLVGFSAANPRLQSTTGLVLATGPSVSVALRHAAVTSMGFGGTNAHVILKAAEASVTATPASGACLLPLSADSSTALSRLAAKYANFVEANPDSWASIAVAAAAHRYSLDFRASAIGENASELIRELRGIAANPDHERIIRAPVVAFVFSGQGAQAISMGSQFYANCSAFRHQVEVCDAILREHCAVSVLDLFDGNATEAAQRLSHTSEAQLAIVVCQLGVVAWLKTCGIEPAIVYGHSLGEYVAAHVAGAIELEDLLKLVHLRAQAMESAPDGGMIAARANVSRIKRLISESGSQLEIAAENSAEDVTLTGDQAELDRFAATCENAGIVTARVRVAKAFHSSHMAATADIVARAVFRDHAPRLPLISNITGKQLDAIDSAYFARHLRSPVNFVACTDTAFALGARYFIEIGGEVLRPFLSKNLSDRACGTAAIASGRHEWRSAMKAFSNLFQSGVSPDWRAVFAGPHPHADGLPSYPFDLTAHWLDCAPVAQQPRATTGISMSTSHEAIINSSGSNDISWLDELRPAFANLLKLPTDAVSVDRTFLDQGADSLVLTEFVQQVKNRSGVELPLGDLFDRLVNLRQLSDWLGERATPPGRANSVTATSPAAPATVNLSVSARVSAVIAKPEMVQAAPMSAQTLFQEQLAVFERLVHAQIGAVIGTAPATAAPAAQIQEELFQQYAAPSKPVPVASAPAPRVSLTASQSAHVQSLADAYCTKTAASKQYAVDHREVFADYRSSLGFRHISKEMTYPLVVASAAGSRVVDIDGNEYIDLTMAFGSSLLGHNPPPVIEALRNQLQHGIQVGPKSPLSGEAARLVAELTGMDRVAFANSGTEAVMTALRLARTVTGHSRYVRFTGSYHGHADAVLARAGKDGIGMPMTQGVPASTAGEALVVDYGDDDALEIIRSHAGEIAAVVIEPVQSRRPGLQPGGFLRRLRDLADEKGFALIFDEIITGFRLAPGGAQEYFGVRADLATYGKVAGGGMPIGIIAGTTRFMNAIDGGAWRYGDESGPNGPTTFFAGTFSAHPLTMAATIAVLKDIRARSHTLYSQLNELTTQMARSINEGFVAEGLPIHVDCAGSLFRFVFMKNFSVEFQPVEASLFFYHMALSGIYIWEGHTCFLSESHTQADVDAIVAAALKVGRSLRDGGFLLGAKTASAPLAVANDQARIDAFNRIATAAFVMALATLDIKHAIVDRPSPEVLGQRLNVVPARARLWLSICKHLVAADTIHLENDRILSIKVHKVNTALAEFDAALAAARNLGEPEAVLALMSRCAAVLPDVLSGKSGGAEALFTNGGIEQVAAIYASAPGAVVAHTALKQRFAETLKELASPNHVLRILEVGAGTGDTTRQLLPLLEGQHCRYVFSDISPAFLHRAEAVFSEHHFMKFVTLDLERPINEQQLPFDECDIIVAVNVVHATAQIGETLDRLHGMLAPAGVLMLVECSARHAWLDLIFGLTDGWWRYTDTDLRDHALLDAATWRTVLAKSGWHGVHVDTFANSILLISAGQGRDANSRVPMSVMQREILVHLALGEAVLATYNEGVLCEIRGSIDSNWLQLALDALVAQHDSLSAVVDDDGTHLRTGAAGPPSIETLDFSAFGTEIAQSKAREWLKLRVAEPFDLRSGPLLRAFHIQFDEGRSWLYLIGHHLIIDGFSFGSLLVEWMERYDAFGSGRTPTLPRPLSLAEANRRQAGWSDKDRAFWLERLADMPPPLDLPTDRAFPVEQTFDAGRVNAALPAELGTRLSAFCRSAGVTPFMALFGAWRVLLHKLCGQNRSIIGVPVSVHGVRANERYIGFGVNVLPVPGDTDLAQSWRSYLEGMRGEFLQCLEHRSYPLPELLRDLNPVRDLSRPTLVSVLFNYEVTAVLKGHDLQMEPIAPPIVSTKYELTLDMIGCGNDYQAVLSYSCALFDEASADVLLQRYMALLDRMISAPDAALGNHGILVEGEKPWLVGAPVPPVASSDHLAARVESQVDRTPDAVALRWNDDEISYRDLDQRANALAHHLVAMGACPGKRVAVCLSRTPGLVVSLLAILKSGAAYVPLDMAYPADRQGLLLSCAKVDILISESGYEPPSSAPTSSIVTVDAAGCAEGVAQAADNTTRLAWLGSPQQLAYIIFTSGSTGMPKGVTIQHSSALSLLDWAGTVFSDADVAGVLASTSICFDLSVFELFVPLTRGGRIILIDNALQLTELARTDDISLINTVPSAMEELLRLDILPASLRIANLAGEALAAELVARIHRRRADVAVYNLYGPSEDTTYSTFVRVPVGCQRVTIGIPVGGTALYIMDETGRNPLPAGSRGTIHLAGVGLAQDYFGQAELTAASFVEDPIRAVPGGRMYNTGDIGRLNRHGEIEYLGRRDGQVKIRGHRIEIAEIESVIARVPGIKKATVLAAPSEAGDLVLSAFYVSSAGASDIDRAVREAISVALPRYMMPSRFISLEAFPLTPNGKTDRKRLIDLSRTMWAEGANGAVQARPTNETEAQLSDLWCELLGLPGVGVTDNFFELGGHSLMATRLVTEIDRCFGRTIRLTDILRAPTIEQLARVFEN